MAFTNGNDVHIIQSSNTTFFGAGAGDDTYILSPVTLTGAEDITITDVQGVNSLQLVGGLQIASWKVASDALELTLNNKATVTVLNAGTFFTYEPGGNATAGINNADVSFATFVTNTLKTTVPTGGSINSGGPVTITTNDTVYGSAGDDSIQTGNGDDTVIFDVPNDTRAGLTVADTVNGGPDNDTLVIDGDLVAPGVIALGSSEWANIIGFETIKVINAGPGSSYRLTLTNTLFDNNAGGLLNIVNDNDLANDISGGADTVVTTAESPIVIDARSLSLGRSFTYNGEEGASRTTDRFIFGDASLNGSQFIDGGAVNNNPTVNPLSQANADVLEVRNTTVVTLSDLVNLRNVGILELSSDVVAPQTVSAQLNDAVVDSMVDSYRPSSISNVERLTVRALDADPANLPSATMSLNLDAVVLTSKSALDVLVGRGTNNIVTGAGADTLTLLGNYATGAYAGKVAAGLAVSTLGNNAAGTEVVISTYDLGGGVDTLVTYGAINLAGATLNGIEAFSFNSDVTIRASQLLGRDVVFNAPGAHVLTIQNDLAQGQTLDLNRFTLAAGSANAIINTNGTAFTGAGNDQSVVGDIVFSIGVVLTPSVTTVNEGSSVIFNLSTTGVALGTALPYTLSGTGITANDFSPAALTGSFTVGSNGQATVTLMAAADLSTENNETFTLALNGGLASAAVTIVDTSQNPLVTLSGPSVVNEGSSATYTVTLSAAVSSSVSIPYTLSGTASSGADYTGSTSGVITVSAGATTGTLTLPILADQVTDPNETVVVTLGTLPSGYALTGNGTVTTTINDTSQGIFSISGPTVTKEGSSAVFTVSLNAVQAVTTLVSYSVVPGGGATAGLDYGVASVVPGSGVTLSGSTLAFAPGATTALIFVPILVDSVSPEIGETVTVSLSSPVNAVLGTSGATTILQDVAPTYALSPSTTAINEGSSVTFNLVTTGVAAGTLLPYTLSGTGIIASDFGPATLTGSFTVGADGKASVTLTAAADLTTEGNETFTLALNNGLAVSTPVTIIDTSTTPPVNTIILPVGSTAPVAATAAADNFTFSVVGALASNPNTQITVSGFNTTADSLQLDLPGSIGAGLTRLNQLNGLDLGGGDVIAVQVDQIHGTTVINFGSDADGNVVVIALAGVIDPFPVNISVV